MGPLSFVMLIQVHQYELTRNWFKSHSISRISGVPMPSNLCTPAADKVCCPYCNAAHSVKNSLVPLSWRMLRTDGTADGTDVFFPHIFWGFCRFPSPFFYHSADCDYETQLRSVAYFDRSCWGSIMNHYESGVKDIDRGTTLEWKKTNCQRVSSQVSTAPQAAGRSTFFLWSVVVIIVILYYHHAWLSHHNIHPITIQCHSSSTCGQFELVLGSPGTHWCPSVPIGPQDLKAFFSPGEPAVNRCLWGMGGWPWHAVFKKIVVEATFIQSVRGCSWFWSIWFCSMTWVYSATHHDTAVFTVSEVPAITSW